MRLSGKTCWKKKTSLELLMVIPEHSKVLSSSNRCSERKRGETQRWKGRKKAVGQARGTEVSGWKLDLFCSPISVQKLALGERCMPHRGGWSLLSGTLTSFEELK